MSYYDQLQKFLTQSKTTNLSYSQYANTFLDLKVRVSFGQGGAANVPWISFLRDGQSTQKGIYPVYLYYKKNDILVLAYGVSETFTADKKWDSIDLISIEEYFKKNNLEKPFRYGKSYVFRSYDVKNMPSKDVIDNDLFELIDYYKSLNLGSVEVSEEEKIKALFKLDNVFEGLNKSGLLFDPNIIARFITSLITKPFVILTGLSGSGKTKLAQAFAMFLCGSQDQYKIVPVGADWTNREPLLGFPNALLEESYVCPESGVLQLLLAAKNNPLKPYFLILDEMNLSHVERYFADFLSTMESDEEILLHAGNEEWNSIHSKIRIPAKIRLPKNLLIVGTVNIDETTYMFSPKVLDRANVIEFRVTEDEMNDFLQIQGKVDLDAIQGKGSSMESTFIAFAQNKDLSYSVQSEMNDTLIGFFNQLKEVGAEFGYRTASEIRRFAAVAEALDSYWNSQQILDFVIMQKLLPKLHGSRRKLEPVLKTLISLCIGKDEKIEDYLQPKNNSDKSKVLYPIALEKLQRMYRGLIDNGFTSYAEA